ncbi:MAG: hypothetical protein U9Q39_05235 [Pseudomonadota bacterium]|nr:hypothetical protein [Pseudomonadota bacterium]
MSWAFWQLLYKILPYEVHFHPYTLLEIVWYALIGQEKSMSELVQRPYDEKNYRVPVGIGVCASLIFLFLYALIYMRVAG